MYSKYNYVDHQDDSFSFIRFIRTSFYEIKPLVYFAIAYSIGRNPPMDSFAIKFACVGIIIFAILIAYVRLVSRGYIKF